MKHIKLFEDFTGMGGETKYLIGYFATGGIGSHPGIATAEELERLGWQDSGEKWTHPEMKYYFIVTSESNETPQALLCVFDEKRLWKIEPISEQEAQEIYDLEGHEDLNPELEEVRNKIKSMPALNGWDDIIKISVLQDVEPNMVYWSDEPEQFHGYWQAKGASPLPLEVFTYNGDINMQ
jgi:hypothetical protein